MTLAWILGGVLVVLILTMWARRRLARPEFILVANPERMEVVQYETEPVALILRGRAWRGGAWADVRGSYLLSAERGGVFSFELPRGGAHARNAIFSVALTGIMPGEDHLIVSATPVGQTKACVGRFPVVVTPNPDGERRLRQSVAALKAK